MLIPKKDSDSDSGFGLTILEYSGIANYSELPISTNRPQILADLKQNVAAYVVEVTAETRKEVGQNFCFHVKACFNKNQAYI